MEELKYKFKRKIYNKILEWKNREQGASALLVEGARRIGKSVITEEFAKNEYVSYLKIDFSKAPAKVIALFDDLSDLNNLFMQLQFEYLVKLIPRKSVIIFDEVQFAPKARQAIKHLVEDGRFDYIETGSLISIRKNVEKILIPSEEDIIKMYPMDFEEFLWAIGEDSTPDLLRMALYNKKPLGDVAHRKMMRTLRLYMLVGGMPQAISKYLETLDLSAVDIVKRRILNLYDSDFMKIDDSGRISRIFENIPGQLGRQNNRFFISNIIGSTTERKQNSLLSELKESMTANFCHHTANPANGLAMDFDKDYFKLYCGDTGLFVTLAFKSKDFIENVIYSKLLSDKIDANLGYLYENLVAQMLVASGRGLYYYTFPTKNNKHNYEVDFLIDDGTKINPIEVKSSGYKAHVSLDAFCKKYSSKIRQPYIFYTKDYAKEGNTIYLPIYLVPFLFSKETGVAK